MHLAELVENRARREPGARCVSDDAGTLVNGRFDARVRSVVGLLARRGVRHGEVVVTLLTNRIEFAHFEVSRQLEDSATHLVVVADGRPSPTGAADTLDGRSLWSAADAGPAPRPVTERDDLDPLIDTDDGIGKPKGVRQDHGNLESRCDMAVTALELTGTDHCPAVPPLFQAAAVVGSVLSPPPTGASTTVAGSCSAGRFFDVEAVGPTCFSTVPAIHAMPRDLAESVRRTPVPCDSPAPARRRCRASWRTRSRVATARRHRGLRPHRGCLRLDDQPAVWPSETRHGRPTVARAAGRTGGCGREPGPGGGLGEGLIAGPT